MSGSQQLQGSRVTNAVLSWVNLYTRALPADLAHSRREEIWSDIYEQHADAARKGLPPRALNRSIALRAVRGAFADITWSTIHHNRRAGTMAATVENSPARQRIAGQLTAALWGAVAVVAVIGLTGSMTEMINTGGQVHGLIAWPGAASVNLTVLVLIASAATLMLMTGVGAMRWRRAKSAI